MTTSGVHETFDGFLWLIAVLLLVFGAVRTGQAAIGLGFEVAGAIGPERMEPPPPGHAPESTVEAAAQARHREWRREMNRRTQWRSVAFAVRGLAQSSLWLLAGLVLLQMAKRRLARYEIPP